MAGMLKPTAKNKPADGEESDAYKAAMAFVMEKLYRAEAARQVADAVKKAPNPAEGLAEFAYEIVTIADERTQGAIGDEEIIEFASEVLGEVAEIAEAAGVKVTGQVIAEATRSMLIRWVTEQGGDPTQLQAEMGKIDTAQLGAELEKQGG